MCENHGQKPFIDRSGTRSLKYESVTKYPAGTQVNHSEFRSLFSSIESSVEVCGIFLHGTRTIDVEIRPLLYCKAAKQSALAASSPFSLVDHLNTKKHYEP